MPPWRKIAKHDTCGDVRSIFSLAPGLEFFRVPPQCRCREGCAACVSQIIIWLCFLESCKSIRCCVKEPKLFGSLQFQRCVNSLSPEYLRFNPRARPLPSSSSFAHSLHIHSLPASSPTCFRQIPPQQAPQTTCEFLEGECCSREEEVKRRTASIGVD